MQSNMEQALVFDNFDQILGKFKDFSVLQITLAVIQYTSYLRWKTGAAQAQKVSGCKDPKISQK